MNIKHAATAGPTQTTNAQTLGTSPRSDIRSEAIKGLKVPKISTMIRSHKVTAAETRATGCSFHSPNPSKEGKTRMNSDSTLGETTNSTMAEIAQDADSATRIRTTANSARLLVFGRR